VLVFRFLPKRSSSFSSFYSSVFTHTPTLCVFYECNSIHFFKGATPSSHRIDEQTNITSKTPKNLYTYDNALFFLISSIPTNVCVCVFLFFHDVILGYSFLGSSSGGSSSNSGSSSSNSSSNSSSGSRMESVCEVFVASIWNGASTWVLTQQQWYDTSLGYSFLLQHT